MSSTLTDPIPDAGGRPAHGPRYRLPWTKADPTRPAEPDAPTEAGLSSDEIAGSGGSGQAGAAGETGTADTHDPRWVRPALAVLLIGTAVLYLWDLGASGWSNSFYSAAVQAGTVSWKAFFYGSSDAGNSITVDKPPASLWVMALSARIFGLNSWSILVPEALMGVASVGLLYKSVRRYAGAAAGLIAGAVLALTPIAAVMFKFNNPDALLVLLLIGGAYATLRAVENASARWMVLAGVLVSFAFLTKLLQALVVVPVFALVYLAFAPATFWKRVRDTLLGGLGLLVPAGLFIAIVELVPASSRPYIGGSQHNSLLELTIGYNGLGRITGNETGSVTGGGGAARRAAAGTAGQALQGGTGTGGAAAGGAGTFMGPGGPGGGPGGRGGGMWGQTGLTRMFSSEVGGQISWLLPAALILLVAGLWFTRRAPRTDRLRAALVLWGGWLLVTGLIFSEMQGIFHPYYTVALAPAIGAVVGIGAVLLWRNRYNPVAAVGGAAAIGVTTWWSYKLLNRTPDWHPWIRYVVLVTGIIAALGFLASIRLPRRAALGVALVALVAGLFGPGAYTIATAQTPHTGSIPSAGPAGAGFGGFGGGPGGFARRGNGANRGFGQRQAGGFPGGFGGQGGTGALPGGGTAGQGAPGGQGMVPGQGGMVPGQGGTAAGGTGTAARPGGAGGLLSAATPGKEIVDLFKANASGYTWVAAAVGSNSAAGYQLATGKAVMPIGGFNGSDPSPTLDQFKKYVSEKKIHYFIAGGGFGQANGGSNDSGSIVSWIEANFTAKTVGGVTLYDLTAPKAAASGTSSDATAQTT